MSAARLRVLIVDDQADTARMMRVLLKGQGYEVRVEFDGEHALRTAAEFSPRVVLLDLSLPGKSGLEVADEMRAMPSMAGASLVAVTGQDSYRLPTPSPFDRHFLKPVDHDALNSYLAGIDPGEASI